MADLKTREPSIGLARRRQNNEAEFFQHKVESILTENSYESVKFIATDRLVSFKNQRRSYFNDEKMTALADTIKEHGIRQPLTVIQSDDDQMKFEIVSGERRLMAAKMIGLDKVPCIIIHNRKAAEEIAVIENVQRVDLHPIELGKAYSGLLNNGIVNSKSDLAAKIGVPRTQVSEYIGFADFPESISRDLISNNISSRRILRKISRCSDIEEMEKVVLSALGVDTGEKGKTVIRISLKNGEIESEIFEKVNLNDQELDQISKKLYDLAEFIKGKRDGK